MEVVVVGAVAAAVFFGLRIVAARRVAAGDGRFVWVVFGPTLVGCAAILWGAASALTTMPLMGMPLAVGAVIYLSSNVRFLRRTMTGVNQARTPDEIAAAVTDPFVEHVTLLIVLVLIGGLIAVAGLIAWGVSRAAG
jgi:hypothetical protein